MDDVKPFETRDKDRYLINIGGKTNLITVEETANAG